MSARRLRHVLPLVLALMATCHSRAGAQNESFSFGALSLNANRAMPDGFLHAAFENSDGDNLAFVALDGIKTAGEECSTSLFQQRHDLVDSAKNGVIYIPAAADWSACSNVDSGSAALERLNLLRELFFNDDFSSGSSRIPVVRQSASVKFRSYTENMRWVIGEIMFATIDLPGNNNNYRAEAGRNGEFEDRLVADREWLRHVFAFAGRANARGLVIFCDANPWARPVQEAGRRDGFTEIRALIEGLAAKFDGRILIVSGAANSPHPGGQSIAWRRNLGLLQLPAGWAKITTAAKPEVFTVKIMPVDSAGAH